jgi:hypothetical protein
MKFETEHKESLSAALHNRVVDLKFLKVNGEMRFMACTLQSEYLPAPKPSSKEKPYNPDIQAVWDVEADDWRRFRWDSVTEWDGEEITT